MNLIVVRAFLISGVWDIFPALFPDRRIKLSGEAFFRVAHQGTSFFVTTGNAEVHVLGTEFNVRSRTYGADLETQVSLVSGKVKFYGLMNSAKEVILDQPGASAVVTSTESAQEELSSNDENLDHVLAWRNRGLRQTGQPIHRALRELSLRYNISLSTEGGLDAETPVTLQYTELPDIEVVLNDICLGTACNYRKTSTGYIIYPADD